MIKIKSLEIEGFRSFKKLTKIEFPENGLVLLNGKYKDSGLSSGSGKSSILMAIAFALDICDLPATELKNWDSNKLYVKLVVTNDNDIIEIVKNPKLSLVINGTVYESLTTGSKEKLQQIFKTSPELLQTLTYRPQRSSGNFINLTDSEIKEFLTEVLSLNEIEKTLELLEQEFKNLETEFIKNETKINTLNSNLSLSLTADQDLEKAKKDYEDCVKKVQDSQNTKIDENLENEYLLLQAKCAEAKTISNKYAQAKYENQTYRSQILNLKQELEKLKEHICYTCNREWDENAEAVSDKETRIKLFVEKMAVNLSIIKNSEPIIENLDNLEKKLFDISTKISQSKNELSNALYAKGVAERALKSITAVNENLKNNKDLLIKLKSDAVELENKIQIKKIQIGLLGKAGFLGVIFDEVLKEIEIRSNDMIKNIPNVSEFTISLNSNTTSKTTGNVKKAISKKIYKNDKELSVKALSGGQQCSLELCVDLAVAETIRSRHGTQLNWIALDEAMDGLGVAEKQAALDMIRQKVKGLVLIVDHATEIKEAFEKIIDIEYNGRESYVVDNS